MKNLKSLYYKKIYFKFKKRIISDKLQILVQ